MPVIVGAKELGNGSYQAEVVIAMRGLPGKPGQFEPEQEF